jgi:hypothetical protein
MSQDASQIEAERRQPHGGGYAFFGFDSDPAFIAQHLGAQLRVLYGDVSCEPVPERFDALARELDRPDQKGL